MRPTPAQADALNDALDCHTTQIGMHVPMRVISNLLAAGWIDDKYWVTPEGRVAVGRAGEALRPDQMDAYAEPSDSNEPVCGESYDHTLKVIDERDGWTAEMCVECDAEIVTGPEGEN